MLVAASAVTLLCCLPVGIVAIAKAVQARALWAQGNHDRAWEVHASTNRWVIATVAAGLIFMVVALAI